MKPSFNWGYDPQNYNVPEGSYSSDPTNPKTRIFELKSAIAAMHEQKLRVNMDVVYNHVYNPQAFSQNLIVPGYFFRTDNNGNLTNGSGIGNDIASERQMVRKFIVDSVNSLKWNEKAKNIVTYKYIQGLVSLRKAHPAFRMNTEAQVVKNLKFYPAKNDVVMYSIAGKPSGDEVASFVVIHNPNTTSHVIKLPRAGKWSVVVSGDKAGVATLSSGTISEISVPGQSTMVLKQ